MAVNSPSKKDRAFGSLLTLLLVILIWILSPSNQDPTANLSGRQWWEQVVPVPTSRGLDPNPIGVESWLLNDAIPVYFVSRPGLPMLHLNLSFTLAPQDQVAVPAGLNEFRERLAPDLPVDIRLHQDRLSIEVADLLTLRQHPVFSSELRAFLNSGPLSEGGFPVLDPGISMVGALDPQQARQILAGFILPENRVRQTTPDTAAGFLKLGIAVSLTEPGQDPLSYLYRQPSPETLTTAALTQITEEEFLNARLRLAESLLANSATNLGLSRLLSLIQQQQISPEGLNQLQSALASYTLADFQADF